MSTRSNGGIIGPQNRTTSASANGVWHLFDAQQSVQARNWPGFTPVVPSPPAVGTVTVSGTTATIPYTLGYNGGSTITKITAVSVPGGFTGTVTASPPSAAISVAGLTPGTTYSFYVYATNAIGDGTGANSNSITTASSLSVEYLIIAGGGAGSFGGGGAGGLLTSTINFYTASVTIGAGGTTGAATASTSGTNSTITYNSSTTLTSVGGGCGGDGGCSSLDEVKGEPEDILDPVEG